MPLVIGSICRPCFPATNLPPASPTKWHVPTGACMKGLLMAMVVPHVCSAMKGSHSRCSPVMAIGRWTLRRPVQVPIATATHMNTKMMITLHKHLAARSIATFAFAIQAACAQQPAPEPAVPAPSFSSQPFPSSALQYQARLFELTEPGEKKYNAAFERQLRQLVAPQLAKNTKFLARLTSGPTETGTYYAVGQRAYAYYPICQAHQCDTTTMEILFDPSTNRMVGKLLDRCAPMWLGQPDKVEMALLEQRHQASYPATATACAGK